MQPLATPYSELNQRKQVPKLQSIGNGSAKLRPEKRKKMSESCRIFNSKQTEPRINLFSDHIFVCPIHESFLFFNLGAQPLFELQRMRTFYLSLEDQLEQLIGKSRKQ